MLTGQISTETFTWRNCAEGGLYLRGTATLVEQPATKRFDRNHPATEATGPLP